MNQEIKMLDDIKTENRKFHYSKCPININNADIIKTIISNKGSFVKKRF